MYTEIGLINKISDRQTRLSVSLLFLREYSGWAQHLSNVGLTWGAAGEEVGAAKELRKVNKHITKLENLIKHDCL